MDIETTKQLREELKKQEERLRSSCFSLESMEAIIFSEQDLVANYDQNTNDNGYSLEFLRDYQHDMMERLKEFAHESYTLSSDVIFIEKECGLRPHALLSPSDKSECGESEDLAALIKLSIGNCKGTLESGDVVYSIPSWDSLSETLSDTQDEDGNYTEASVGKLAKYILYTENN